MAEGGSSPTASRQLPWFPCRVDLEPDEDDDTPFAGAGAPSYVEKRWPTSKPLRVYFMNDVPSTQRLANGDPITEEMILTWANAWSRTKHPGLQGEADDGRLGIVPKFELHTNGSFHGSDIRVEFMTGGGSASMIGKTAKDFEDSTTMWLDLSYCDDDYHEYTVVHEFGHALGLGHEHQMKTIATAIDKKKTIAFLEEIREPNVTARFKRDYKCYSKDVPKEGVEFDPLSVMCYPIPRRLFKNGTKLPLDVIEKQNYDVRKKLSRVDVVTILQLYSSDGKSESCLLL